MSDFFPGAVLAFLGGAAVAVVNHALTQRQMRKKPDKLPSFFIFRQILNIACLGGVYLLCEFLGRDTMTPLIAAALGLTLSSVVLASRLSGSNGRAGKNSGKGASH